MVDRFSDMYHWSDELEEDEKEKPVPDSTPDFSFGIAIDKMKIGLCVARHGWNGKGQFIALQEPDTNSANTLPYIWINTVDGERVPWLASQTDMLSEDWFAVMI